MERRECQPSPAINTFILFGWSDGWSDGSGEYGRPEEQRREEGRIDRWNGCGCYSILTDQSGASEICILSTVYPHLAKEAT